MAGSSWAAAIDYFIAGLPAPLRAIEPTVQVVDNVPAAMSETMVVIGRQSPESGQSATVDQSYVELGQQRIEEVYTLPGYVCVWRPGPSQKASRDAAKVLFDAVVSFVHADPTLGGLLQRGRIARMSRFAPHQTQDDEDTAGGGYLYTGIDFEFEIHNTYIP